MCYFEFGAKGVCLFLGIPATPPIWALRTCINVMTHTVSLSTGIFTFIFYILVDLAGLEPATLRLWVGRSYQLSYRSIQGLHSVGSAARLSNNSSMRFIWIHDNFTGLPFNLACIFRWRGKELVLVIIKPFCEIVPVDPLWQNSTVHKESSIISKKSSIIELLSNKSMEEINTPTQKPAIKGIKLGCLSIT